jgi:hypothetical protein
MDSDADAASDDCIVFSAAVEIDALFTVALYRLGFRYFAGKLRAKPTESPPYTLQSLINDTQGQLPYEHPLFL